MPTGYANILRGSGWIGQAWLRFGPATELVRAGNGRDWVLAVRQLLTKAGGPVVGRLPTGRFRAV